LRIRRGRLVGGMGRGTRLICRVGKGRGRAEGGKEKRSPGIKPLSLCRCRASRGTPPLMSDLRRMIRTARMSAGAGPSAGAIPTFEGYPLVPHCISTATHLAPSLPIPGSPTIRLRRFPMMAGIPRMDRAKRPSGRVLEIL